MLLELLSYYATGQEIGNAIGGLWYGSHSQEIQQAYDLLSDYEKSGCVNQQALHACVQCLQGIPDDEKDYILVCKYYFLACAYMYECQFSASFRCLDFIDSVEIGFFTAKSDTIQEFQESAKNLRQTVRKREKEYLKSLKKSSSSNSKDSSNKWVFLIVAFLLCVGLIFLCYFLFK